MMVMHGGKGPERSNGDYNSKRIATIFVINIGVMSVFADLTYEGFWGVLGP
jgi:hypothetical protein